jgi:murein DD-endopeptidase MepM/ murein hydrolase activator NlpD
VFEAGSAGFTAATDSGSMVIARAMAVPMRAAPEITWRDRLSEIDWVPDLGSDIGSLNWFRGLGTLTVLCGLALALLPGFHPLPGTQAPLPSEGEFEELRAQMIMPIAFGSDSGRRMGANEYVVSLGASPERPSIEMTARMGSGDSFARVLQRAGVGGAEAKRVENMVSDVTALDGIASGTPLDIVLGARPSKTAPRPLQSLAFRARFDLNLQLVRAGGAFRLIKQPIAVDNTPLRIRGLVGAGIYKSARAAGAPAEAIQNYLKIIAGRTNLSNVRETDEFDMIVEYRRAATGEVEVGSMLYAGLDRDGKSAIQMLKWTVGENTQWFEASGVGETRGAMGRPVNGPITSGYGSRRHPVLGYVRMHSGMDFGAGYGAPIYAVTDGRIAFAGRKGGYGNFIQINHGGGMATGYGHMSRFAAQAGQAVRRGQIIGYVGSTGLSTGPHLHYELYRNGHAINPASVTFTQRAQLEGQSLVSFRARLANLKSVKPGQALGSMQAAHSTASQAPVREIDRLTRPAT